jgi:hypothetical protein
MCKYLLDVHSTREEKSEIIPLRYLEFNRNIWKYRKALCFCGGETNTSHGARRYAGETQAALNFSDNEMEYALLRQLMSSTRVCRRKETRVFRHYFRR